MRNKIRNLIKIIRWNIYSYKKGEVSVLNSNEKKSIEEATRLHWEKISSYLPESNNNKINVLDFGCGGGRFGFFLKERYPQCSLFAYDVNLPLLLKVKEKKTYDKILISRTSFKKINNKIDIIFLNHVIGGITSTERISFINSLVSLLKNQQSVIILIENITEKEGSDFWKPLSESQILKHSKFIAKKVFEFHEHNENIGIFEISCSS